MFKRESKAGNMKEAVIVEDVSYILIRVRDTTAQVKLIFSSGAITNSNMPIADAERLLSDVSNCRIVNAVVEPKSEVITEPDTKASDGLIDELIKDAEEKAKKEKPGKKGGKEEEGKG